MSIDFPQTDSVYSLDGLYYAIKGARVIQFDDNYYLEIPPNNELYGYMLRRLRKIKPMARGEALMIVEKLLKRTIELKESI